MEFLTHIRKRSSSSCFSPTSGTLTSSTCDILKIDHARHELEQAKIHRKNLYTVLNLAITHLIEKYGNQIIEDNNPDLSNLFAILESIFIHRLKVRKCWFSLEEDTSFWEYVKLICRAVYNGSCIQLVENMGYKTSKAKGRAWIRLAMIEKRLDVYVSEIIKYRQYLKQYHYKGAYIISQEGKSLPEMLEEANKMHIAVCVKDLNLDDLCYDTIDFTPFMVVPDRLSLKSMLMSPISNESVCACGHQFVGIGASRTNYCYMNTNDPPGLVLHPPQDCTAPFIITRPHECPAHRNFHARDIVQSGSVVEVTERYRHLTSTSADTREIGGGHGVEEEESGIGMENEVFAATSLGTTATQNEEGALNSTEGRIKLDETENNPWKLLFYRMEDMYKKMASQKNKLEKLLEQRDESMANLIRQNDILSKALKNYGYCNTLEKRKIDSVIYGLENLLDDIIEKKKDTSYASSSLLTYEKERHQSIPATTLSNSRTLHNIPPYNSHSLNHFDHGDKGYIFNIEHQYKAPTQNMEFKNYENVICTESPLREVNYGLADGGGRTDLSKSLMDLRIFERSLSKLHSGDGCGSVNWDGEEGAGRKSAESKTRLSLFGYIENTKSFVKSNTFCFSNTKLSTEFLDEEPNYDIMTKTLTNENNQCDEESPPDLSGNLYKSQSCNMMATFIDQKLQDITDLYSA